MPKQLYSEKDRIAAILAACKKIRRYDEIDAKQLEAEVAWQEREACKNINGSLRWKTFEVGEEFIALLRDQQEGRCCYCHIVMNNNPESEAFETLEHRQPKAMGGMDHPDNLALACKGCNWKRGGVFDGQIREVVRRLANN